MIRLGLVALAACAFQHGGALTDGAADAPRVRGDARPSPPADGPPPAITFGQVENDEGQDLMTVPVAFTKPQLAGDLAVVMVGWYKAGTISTLADSSGNTYALVAGPTQSGTEYQAIYYACNIAAAAAGANTVTVTFAAAGQDPDVRIAEYSGIATASCLDAATSGTGTGTAIDSGPLATHHAHDLLVAADFQVNQTSSGDASYTTRTITGFGDLVEDREVTATGSYHATATEDSAGAWVMQLAAFAGE